jgi:hypothetical protein
MSYTVPTSSITCPVTYTVSTTSSLYSSVTGATGSPYTFNTGAGNVVLNGSTWNTSITSTSGNLTGAGLHVTSDAEFDGNIKWKGRDLGKMIETIERRLAILQPNPKKLKKFEALQKAYDHYKLLEALCHSEDDND